MSNKGYTPEEPITAIATALIIGILTNLLVRDKKAEAPAEETVTEEDAVEEVAEETEEA